MSNRVERLRVTRRTDRPAESMLVSAEDGPLVRWSNYEKLEKALQEAEDRFEFCDNCERPSREEDLETIWCREPESGEQVDARICLVCRLGAEHDQALQALAEAKEERDPSIALLTELEEMLFSTSDGSDDPNRASLIDALRRFVDERGEEAAAPGSPKAVPVFRYEGGDLNYEPPESAPDAWDGDLSDLIGDYIRLDDHQRRIEVLKHEQMVKVTAEFMRAQKAEKALAEYREGLGSDRAVEALARHRYESGHQNPDGLPWCEADARNFPAAAELRTEARADLQAALQAIPIPERREAECDRCEGHGVIYTVGPDGPAPDYACPDCNGTGKKPAATPTPQEDEG